jgi:hypothetical protein
MLASNSGWLANANIDAHRFAGWLRLTASVSGRKQIQNLQLNGGNSSFSEQERTMWNGPMVPGADPHSVHKSLIDIY